MCVLISKIYILYSFLVTRLTTSLNFAEQRAKEAMEHDEEKIDKWVNIIFFLNKWITIFLLSCIFFFRILIKNLLLGYLSSATSDKSAILRVFANVLNFTDSEKDKTGLNNGNAQSGRPLRSHESGNVPSKVYRIIY